jgi:hypothetical protein
VVAAETATTAPAIVPGGAIVQRFRHACI